MFDTFPHIPLHNVAVCTTNAEGNSFLASLYLCELPQVAKQWLAIADNNLLVIAIHLNDFICFVAGVKWGGENF